MKYAIVARHAKWIGTEVEFLTETKGLSEKLKAAIGNTAPIILTSTAKRAVETGKIIAKQLGAQMPISNPVFQGCGPETNIRTAIEPFLDSEVLIVVCHEENSKLIMEQLIRLLGLPKIKVESLHETGTANVLDCDSAKITNISR